MARRKQRTRTLVLMLLGITAVIAVENWDARHEAEAALSDLMHEHELLALALGTKLTAVARADFDPIERFCADARAVEQRAPVVILFQRERGVASLKSCKGGETHLPKLEQAIRVGNAGIVLSREEAMLLGLPERMAVAGLATAPGGTALAVVGSAGTERDRSWRQQARALISIGVVCALILGFGVVFLRQQKRQLELEQQVELERTRQERDAELAKANRMATLAALASGFAHEIGTPLGIIAGRVEQLRSGRAEPDRREELLAIVTAQVDRIDRLIRSFLGFARGEIPRLSSLSAGEVAQNAVRLVQHRFVTEEVTLAVELGEAAGLRIVCEPALFEQVIVNVLINALEASTADQKVELSLERHPGAVAFKVVDEGFGIPPSALERVTEPFFTTKARSGGSGLGLTIAREIVAHHRGELSVKRRSDRNGREAHGTEVSVRLPLSEMVGQ